MKSYKHKDKRAHIPSREEAGYEDANSVVKEKQEVYMSLNPVTHCGQDHQKIKRNGEKYPVDKAKGTSKKYNEL